MFKFLEQIRPPGPRQWLVLGYAKPAFLKLTQSSFSDWPFQETVGAWINLAMVLRSGQNHLQLKNLTRNQWWLELPAGNSFALVPLRAGAKQAPLQLESNFYLRQIVEL